MKISVNCPSYKRPYVETLEYLPFCKVWVDHKEYDDYVKVNKGFEKNIISCPEGVQGNVSRIRNYILDKEFESGVDVVVIIDDDLKGIYYFEEKDGFAYNKELLSEDGFYHFIEKHSMLCEEFGFKLWGVNINSDSLSYKHYAPFNTTAVILGPFSCHLKNDIRYDESLPLKEDYDLAIQHFNKYRGVLRLNKYHYDCKQSKQAGGCSIYRNYQREEEQLNKLQEKWGSDIVRKDKTANPNAKKKSVHIDYNPIVRVPISGM